MWLKSWNTRPTKDSRIYQTRTAPGKGLYSFSQKSISKGNSKLLKLILILSHAYYWKCFLVSWLHEFWSKLFLEVLWRWWTVHSLVFCRNILSEKCISLWDSSSLEKTLIIKYSSTENLTENCSCLLNTMAKINGKMNYFWKPPTQIHLAQPDQTTSILLKLKITHPD